MPYYTDGLTAKQIKDITKKYVCLVCGKYLFEYLDWQTKRSYLSCGNENHKGIIREVFMDSKALMTMPETQMLARVDMAKFPQELTVVEKKLLAKVAITYGFDPLMGEVSIYQGRPYVSIDGRYRMAQETGKLDGVETRPANKQERIDWQIPDGDYFYRSEVYVKGVSRPFVGWGRVYGSETVGGKGFKPVEKNPQRMAEKRAEAQALRKAFHIPLPSAEDIDSPEDTQSTVRVVDITPEVPTTTPEPEVPQNNAVERQDKVKGGLPEFKTMSEVFNYASKSGMTLAKIKELIGTDKPNEVTSDIKTVVTFLGLK